MTSFPISGPLSLGDLLDRAFRLYRARFGLFIRTAALFLVPMSIISGLLTGTFITDYMDALAALGTGGPAPDEAAIFRLFGGMMSFGVGMFLLALISLVLNGIVTLALTEQGIVALHGESLTVGQGVRQAMRRFWPFVRMMILQSLAYMGATIAILIPLGILFFLVIFVAGAVGLGLSDLNNATGVVAAVGFTLLLLCGYVLALVLMVLPTVYLSARWVAAVPALVNEGGGARTALRRSWALTAGGVRRAVGYVALLWVVGALVIGVPVGVFQQILIVVLPPSATGFATSVSTAISSLFSVLWVPLHTGAIVLLYYDMRVRKESYDLEVRIDQMAAAVGSDADRDADLNDDRDAGADSTIAETNQFDS